MEETRVRFSTGLLSKGRLHQAGGKTFYTSPEFSIDEGGRFFIACPCYCHQQPTPNTMPKKAKAKKAVAKKAKPAKKAKRKPNPALMKPVNVDALLGAVVGDKPAPRGQITKKLWDYIKKNGLRDAK